MAKAASIAERTVQKWSLSGQRNTVDQDFDELPPAADLGLHRLPRPRSAFMAALGCPAGGRG